MDSEPRTARSTSSSPKAAPRRSRRERRRGRDVRINERFAKVCALLEAAQTVWVVWQMVEPPGLPKHVKLIQESDPKRVVMVALSALADRRLYRRLDPSPTSVDADRRVVVGGGGAGGDFAGDNSARAARDNLVPFLRGAPEPVVDPDAGRAEAERARS